jgi:uncharacterized protein (DUF2236 family)
MPTGGSNPVQALTGDLPVRHSSVLFRVASEPAVVCASGPRALLLQVTHPSVAAGVADHSDYQSRPWVRLVRTLAVVSAIAFSEPAHSERESRKLRQRHATVTGLTESGQPYRALDPELLLWVWATLGDCLVRVHAKFVRPLTASERDELYDDWKLVGYACGMPVGGCPDNWADFTAYFEQMVDRQLVPTEVGLNVAGYVRRPPVPFPANVITGEIMHVLTGGQLPDHLRHQLGFSWTPAHQLAFDAASRASRLAARFIPGWVRRAPMTVATSPLVMSNLSRLGSSSTTTPAA